MGIILFKKQTTEEDRPGNRRRWLWGTLAFVMVLVSLLISVPVRVLFYASKDETRAADAAIVLGAAVEHKVPSAVFRERIRHGVELYRNGTVRKLIFTGGQGENEECPEATAAKEMAISDGVPSSAILTETSSTTTYQNFVFAKRVMEEKGILRVLVVSDPLHMMRAMTMARELGIEAYSSPTPTSLYTSASSKWLLLKHEWLYYITYVVRGGRGA